MSEGFAFDPENPYAGTGYDRENLPEANIIDQGCFDTAAEAVCAGSEGAICPPLDATNQEIDWAIRDWQYHELGIDDNPGPWGWTPPDQRG